MAIDLGTARGALAVHLQRLGMNVTAVDKSREEYEADLPFLSQRVQPSHDLHIARNSEVPPVELDQVQALQELGPGRLVQEGPSCGLEGHGWFGSQEFYQGPLADNGSAAGRLANRRVNSELKLAPVAIFFLALYSFCKRFTAMAHVVLGVCLAAAPVGAWIALRGDIGWPVMVLGTAVLFWVAGFDIFYALQDYEHDRDKGLFSIPSRFGVERSFLIVRIFHVLMVVLLLSLVFSKGLGGIYLAGVLLVAGILVYEHLLVKPDDLSRLDAAFFNMNGYISVTIFLFTFVDALV